MERDKNPSAAGAGRHEDEEDRDERLNPGQNAAGTSGVGGAAGTHGGEAAKKYPLTRQDKVQAGSWRDPKFAPQVQVGRDDQTPPDPRNRDQNKGS